MADLDHTAVPLPHEDPAQIARTGRIPEKWVVAIRRHAIAAARSSHVSTSALVADLERIGHTALWLAAVTFDPARGKPFENYARSVIYKSMRSEVRFVDYRLGTTASSSFDHPEEQVTKRVHDEDLPAEPDETYERSERGEIVRAWVGTCPERIQEVFVLIYQHGLTQTEAAEVMKISQPRVSYYNSRLLELGRSNLAHALAA